MHLRHASQLFVWSLLTLVLLTACGGGGSGGSDENSADAISGGRSAPTVPVAESRKGTSYNETIQVASTGDSIALTVFEPAQLEAGESYPLVLHSHGYGGSRNVAGDPSDFQQRLIDAGYYVISFDQRGFGESSGTVRVQSPDFEGRDLIALLDWAEDLPGLARRGNDKMLVGSYGGSYGGMFQLLMAAADPEQRLRVIAPDITPNDLVYSLNPGVGSQVGTEDEEPNRGVIKSGWALALVGGGELPLLGLAQGTAGPEDLVQELLSRLQNLDRPTRQDPVILGTLVRGAVTNSFPEAGKNLFAYHSFRHFCQARTAGSQEGFITAQPDPISDQFNPGTPPPEIDALFTQGFRDTLFNFNEAYRNYQCLQRAGGDVRLLTHQSGHILPLSLAGTPLDDVLEGFEQALTVPEFQESGGTRTCGSLNLDDVQFAWFQQKLNGKQRALQTALPSGDEVCLSLAENDAVTVDEVPVGGRTFELDPEQTNALSGLTGIVGSLLGRVPRKRLLADQTLYTVPSGGKVLGGIPKLRLNIERVLDRSDDVSDDCLIDALPLACDPIVFVGLGMRSPGDNGWELIDDQLTPLRGYGTHSINMVGVAERLAEGDEIGLIIYGFHPQYPVTLSRDLLTLSVKVSGKVEVPILDASDLARDGV